MNCGKCGFPMMPVLNKRKGWKVICARCGESEPMEPMEDLPAEAAQSAGKGWNYYRLEEFGEAFRLLSEAAELRQHRTNRRHIRRCLFHGGSLESLI